MRTVAQDIRLALRLLRRDPLFTAVAVATLAVGVAATVLVFSVVNAVLLRPLPYPDADRLVTLADAWAHFGPGTLFDPNVPELLDVRAATKTFASIAWVDHRDHQIRIGAEPARTFAARVSPNFFATLGVQPALGRLLSEHDDMPVEQNLLVLSHGLWERRFGSDPTIIGRAITMNGHPGEVVGVLPASFAFDYQSLGIAEPTDIFTLFPTTPDYTLRTGSSANVRRVHVVARLRPGVSRDQAQADLQRAASQIARDHPQFYTTGKGEDVGFGMRVLPLQDAVVHSSRTSLLLLLAAVGTLLLIACANTASLLLAKAIARQPELAIRTALGAGRWRLVRQSLTESLVLAALGGGVALLLTGWLLPILKQLGASRVPRLEEASIDLRVLLFALVVSMLTAVLFGVAPSLQTRAQHLMTLLMQARKSSAGGTRRTRVRDGLVIAQIALSVMLLIGAGLLTRSLLSLQRAPLGFSPDRVLTLQLRLQYYAYAGQAQPSTRYEQILRRVEALPGVESAAMTTGLPTRGGLLRIFSVPGRADDIMSLGRQEATVAFVSPAFFRTLKIPLLAGRVFAASDDNKAPPVFIINDALARQLWPSETGESAPGESAIGKPFRLGRPTGVIVGVVGDTMVSGVARTAAPQIYQPYLQAFEPNMRMVVRTIGDPIAMTKSIEQAAWSVDPDQVLFNAATMDSVLRDAVAEPRQRMLVATLVAGIAMLMALTGLFGLVSYRVMQRTTEFGVRMALGAQPRDVLALVLRHTLVLVLVGLACGVAGALSISRVVASLLYGANARDAATYLAVSLAFGLTALAASALPARRAARVEPAAALRSE
jgi:putative ABC transport system permease protein